MYARRRKFESIVAPREDKLLREHREREAREKRQDQPPGFNGCLDGSHSTLKIHARVKNRIGVARPDRKRHGELKTLLLESLHADTHRLLLLPILRPVPHRPGVVENLKNAVPIIDRSVDHVRPAQRIQLELVPSPQRLRIAQHEPVVQRSRAIYMTCQKRDLHMAPFVAEMIPRARQVTREYPVRL